MTKRNKKQIWVEYNDYKELKMLAAEADIKLSEVVAEGVKELRKRMGRGKAEIGFRL